MRGYGFWNIGVANGNLGMKSMIATIYADFETSVVDDSEMEQLDAVLAPPVADKLLLKFRDVSPSLWGE